tara:strand:- start:14643 stop:15020 length:378 start_codon:yes stop_codon:yes gene_type:complete
MSKEKNKLKLTNQQVERQVRRLKEIIFDDYSENSDGSYEGTLNENVLKIIQSIILSEAEINELQFLQMITEGTKQLVVYLMENIDSVDERVINFFAFDFMTQSIDFMYKIEVQEMDGEEYNPMYG